MEFKTQNSLTDAFLKQLKTEEELQDFLLEIHKRGFEKILEANSMLIWATTSTKKTGTISKSV